MVIKSPSTTAGITVAALREQLKIFPGDGELYLGGLRFNRLKVRGPKLVQLEFHEQVYRDRDGTLMIEDVD